MECSPDVLWANEAALKLTRDLQEIYRRFTYSLPRTVRDFLIVLIVPRTIGKIK
jgi:hypothetical protein